MNKILLTLTALSAGLLISTIIFGADHNCTDCHNSATPSVNDLNKPLSALCADCHATRIVAGEHKVDIAVNIPANTLPLQGGKLTCITCHDPHQPSLALRMPAQDICRQCHDK